MLHLVSDHPNIALLVGAFEDKSHVHLVLEMCQGGELFDRIVAKGNLSEKQAAEYFKTMVQVAAHCHQLGQSVHWSFLVLGMHHTFSYAHAISRMLHTLPAHAHICNCKATHVYLSCFLWDRAGCHGWHAQCIAHDKFSSALTPTHTARFSSLF